jgi:hypothetical protein
MTTLIAVYNSEGCVGRCDAKCYNATSPQCDCICGGKNHGAGLAQARQNTQSMAEAWLDKYIKERKIQNARSEIDPGLKQRSLF